MQNARVSIVTRFLGLRARLIGPLLTLVLAILIEILANTPSHISNPSAFFVLAVVFSAINGGLGSGLVSAVIAWVYIAYSFSLAEQPFRYTDNNLGSVFVWAFILPLLALMAFILHRRAVRALAEIKAAYLRQVLREGIVDDITEHKQVEENFKRVLEAAPDAMVIVDKAGKIRIVNTQTENLFGYKREELYDQTVELLIPERFRSRHPADRAGYILNAKTRAMGGKNDLYGLRKDGSEFPVDISLSPLHTEQDILVIAAIRDITERKLAEETLQEKIQHSQSLLRLSRKLERAQNYSEVLNAALAEVKTIIGYQSLWVFLLSEDKKYFNALTAIGKDAEEAVALDDIATLTIAGDPMLEEIAAAKEIVVVADARTDPRTNKDIVELLQNCTIVNIPIFLFDKRLGAVGTGTFGDQGVHVPTPSEEEYLSALASHMAVSLDRIHLLTERAQAEEQLRYVVLATRDGIYDWDIPNNTVWRNEAYQTLYSPNEPIGTDETWWEQHIHPDDRQLVMEGINKAFRERIHFWTDEYRFRRAEGNYATVIDRGYILYDPAGLPLRMIGALTDITERKRIEQALRESEELYRLLTESSNDLISLMDFEGNVIYVSPSVRQMMGVDPALVIGTNAFITVHAEDAPASQEAWARALTGETVTFLHRSQHADGTWRWLDGWGQVVQFQGQPRVLVVSRDITERKRAEEALYDSDERFRTLYEDNPSMYFTVDTEGTVLSVNRFGAEQLGYTVEELTGSPVLNVFHEEDKQAALLSVRQCIEQPGEAFRWILRKVRKNGGLIWVEENARSIHRMDGSLVVLIVCENITERIRSETFRDEQHQILELIARNAPLEELLTRLVLLIESQFEGMLCSILLLDDDGLHIKHGAAPSLPLEYVRAIDGQAIGPQAGSCGTAMYRGEQVIVTDILTDPLWESYRNFAATYGLRACWSTPILSHEGKMLGSFAMYYREVRSPSSEEIRLIETATNLAGITIERKHAEETLRHRLAELEGISRVSASLRTAQTLEEMLPILLEETLLALESEAGVIWLYHPENDELLVAIAQGWFETLKKLPIKPGEGIAGSVFASGQAHQSREFATDPLVRSSEIASIPRGWGGICVPIRSASEIAGVLFVSVQLPREITPEEARLLISLTEIAGTALHRLRLFEETMLRLEHLQALQIIDRAITNSLDAHITLNTLLEQATRQLGVDAAGVLLFNPHTLTLEYAVGRGFRTRNYEQSRLLLGEGLAGRAALERRLIQTDSLLDAPDFVRAGMLQSEDFVAYAVKPFVAKGELKGVLEVFHRTPLQPDAEWLNFLETLAGQAAIAVDNIQLFESLQRSNLDLTLAYDSTIEGWSHALDLRDKETEGHTRRVTEMTLRLARAAGMTAEELMHVKRGALLHDIGKMGIPDAILLKPDKLTEEEWATMRKHPQYAYDMLYPIEYLRPSLDIPYCHHEKWDGSGYPRGIKGEQIPLAARLFAVVDVWDALTNDRPYRSAWQRLETLDYIRQQSGHHFDPEAVQWFMRIIIGNTSPESTSEM